MDLSKNGEPRKKEKRTVRVRKRRFNPGFVFRIVQGSKSETEFWDSSGSSDISEGLSFGDSENSAIVDAAELLLQVSGTSFYSGVNVLKLNTKLKDIKYNNNKIA